MSEQIDGNQKDVKGNEADLQGEGNYDASRRYRQATEQFVESGKVDEAAQRAKPTSVAEAAELERAEDAGRAGVPRQAEPDE
jgi:hypothetical protein